MVKRLLISAALILFSGLIAWMAHHVAGQKDVSAGTAASKSECAQDPLAERPTVLRSPTPYPETGLPGGVWSTIQYPDTGLSEIVQSTTRYPDTGRPSVLLHIQSGGTVSGRNSGGQVGHASANVPLEDEIGPDEDLLQELVNPPVDGSASSQPSLPAIAPSEPPSDSAPSLPTPYIPKQTPARPVPDELTPQPKRGQSGIQPKSPPAEPRSSAPQPGAYDPNALPAPDEDLLQGFPGAATDESRQSPDANPLGPIPDSDRTLVEPERLPGGSASTPNQRTYPQATPHSPAPTAPAGPFAPPPLVRPLTPPPAKSASVGDGVDPHAEVFADTLYPSAEKCRTCHEQIYDEWASSSHAYASISPMYQKFEQKISDLTKGTIGYFCTRCHAPVATAMGFPREANILDTAGSMHEGVTCVACHRVREQYGKANGERRIEPGDIYQPVYGSGYGEGLLEVLRKKSHYKVKPYPKTKGPGQDIHREVIHFEQISDSSFCVSCHQVVVAPGIELEVVWEQYRASPAHKHGISCQDCHMGSEPGMAMGYETGPVAIVQEKPVSPHRKHSNHEFYGPGYSIAHPGIFPFNPDAKDWTKEEWLRFDYRAGWGTDPFEDAIQDGRLLAEFPKVWEHSDDRYDAREIIDENLSKLRAKRNNRRRLMENSAHVDGPVMDSPARVGKPLKFHYVVTSKNAGHNLPSGSLGAQPQLWVNVALTGPNGQHLWESGYVDANGDVADLHSLEVAAGRIPRDQQLVNYQTKFLITGVKGTDREFYLPINVDIDQLPFIRPSSFPVTTMNHPPFIRMEAHSISPLGSRKARYKVPSRFLQQPGKYRLSFRLRSRAEPIYFMRFCNATPEMERTMNEWMIDCHEHATEFWVH
jgi:hypothetical protein